MKIEIPLEDLISLNESYGCECYLHRKHEICDKYSGTCEEKAKQWAKDYCGGDGSG
jgi:hypothetical protein